MTCFTEGELCPNRPVPNTHIVIVSVFGAGYQSTRAPFSVVFLFSNSPLRGLFPRFCFVPGSVRSSITTTDGNYSGQHRQINVDNINSPSVTVTDPSFISFCVYCARAFVPTLRVAICGGCVVGGWVSSVSVVVETRPISFGPVFPPPRPRPFPVFRLDLHNVNLDEHQQLIFTVV